MQVAQPTLQRAPRVPCGIEAKAQSPGAVHRCLVMAVAMAASNWCAAQQAAITPFTSRDTFSLQSGYFSGDNANNADYVPVVLEQSRGIERLS